MGRSEHKYQFKRYNEESIILHTPGIEHHLDPVVGKRLLLELIDILGVPTEVDVIAYDRAMKSCSRDVGNATRTHAAGTVRRLTKGGPAAVVGESIAQEIESQIIQEGV